MYQPGNFNVFNKTVIGAIIMIAIWIFIMGVITQTWVFFVALPVWLVVGLIAVALTQKSDGPDVR